MKTYKITVDGFAYVVGVEEVNGETGSRQGSALSGQGMPNAVQQQMMQATRPCDMAPVQPTAEVSAPPLGTQPAPPVSMPAAQPMSAGSNRITAPIPGLVLEIPVSAGQSVKAGDTLVILEAMKMENEILAPTDGTVLAVSTAKGAQVNAGDLLVTMG